MENSATKLKCKLCSRKISVICETKINVQNDSKKKTRNMVEKEIRKMNQQVTEFYVISKHEAAILWLSNNRGNISNDKISFCT